jgi:hypothetical protein
VSLFILTAISLVVGAIFLIKKIWLLIAVQVFAWFFMLYSLLDWMPNYRFHVHIMPILFTLIALGVVKAIGRLGRRRVIYGRLAALVFFLMGFKYIETNIGMDKEGGYYEGIASSKKPSGWLSKVPDNVRTGIWPELMREALFLIENTDPGMTVGMRDIGFPGFIGNCRVYDQILLIDKEARAWQRALKMKKGKEIRNYVFGQYRRNLVAAAPDFFLYPVHGGEMKNMDKMYDEYLNDHMDKIKTLAYGEEKIVYYRKKGLKRKLSPEEVILKYEKMVKEHPGYPAFRNRLEELRKSVGKNDET